MFDLGLEELWSSLFGWTNWRLEKLKIWGILLWIWLLGSLELRNG